MTPSSSTEKLKSMESVASVGTGTNKTPPHAKGSHHTEAKAGTGKVELRNTPSRLSNIARGSSVRVLQHLSNCFYKNIFFFYFLWSCW